MYLFLGLLYVCCHQKSLIEGEILMSKTKESKRLERMITIAILGAVAFIIMMLDFPLPLLPPFLKMDFSEIPALLAALIFGPVAGVWVEGIKNIAHYVQSGSEAGFPIGEATNFLAGSILVYTTAVIYRRLANLKGLLYGLLVGALLMVIFMAIANYFVIYPVYAYLLGWPITTEIKFNFAFFAIVPFNIIKALILILLMLPLYQRLKGFIKSKSQANAIQAS